MHGHQTQMMTEYESIISQIVFEQSLRVRLKTAVLDNKRAVTTTTTDKAQTPEDSNGKSPGSTTPTVQRASTSSESGTETDSLDAQEEPDADSARAAEGDHTKEKSGHLVGKINNLITTDTQTIGYSYLATTLRKYTVTSQSSPRTCDDSFVMITSCCCYTSLVFHLVSV